MREASYLRDSQADGHSQLAWATFLAAASDLPCGTRVQEAVRLFKTEHPDQADCLIAQADATVNLRFRLFGHLTFDFANGIPWLRDPQTGRGADTRHWSRIPFLDVEQSGDHKLIWELNRHQHFVVLGQAYLLTGHVPYAQAVIEQFVDWADANPPKHGINWTSSLELAFRVIAWSWSFRMIAASGLITRDIYDRLVFLIHLHGQQIERHLSTYFSPNTHLTGEALGLYYIGACFPELRKSESWQSLGEEILNEQLDKQVKADGSYFEQSTWYQRYTFDFYLHFYLLQRAKGIDSTHIRAGLERMLEFCLGLTRPDGTAPHIGDDDGGTLLPLSCAPATDYKSAFALGTALFGRSDFRHAAQGATDQLLWLMGQRGLDAFRSATPAQPYDMSRAYLDAGLVVMRDSWETDANYLCIDFGPHGALSGAHSHADAMSFELALNGRRVIIDPGTYTYVGDPALRNCLRGHDAHNTVTLSAVKLFDPEGPFAWHRRADSHCGAVAFSPRADYACGYIGRSMASAPHVRHVMFIRGEYFLIWDWLPLGCTGTVHANLQFAADLQLAQRDNHIVVNDGIGETLAVVGVVAPQLSLTIAPASVSPVYGKLEVASRATWQAPVSGPMAAMTFLIPTRVADSLLPWARAISESGWIYERQGAFVDTVAFAGPHGKIRGDGINAICACLWLRRTKHRSLIECVVVGSSGGVSAQIDGRIIDPDGPGIHFVRLRYPPS